MAAAEVGSPRDVFLFYPNLIGYLRVFLALTSFCILGRLPVLFLLCYTVSFVLDAVDGVVARRLGQCSQFGAVLDMVTDRASTVGLLIALVHVLQPLPGWGATLFAFLAFLDISSHFCRMYVSLSTGCNSHKDVSTSSFALMRFYYSNRTFMCALCVGQELFYLVLYTSGVYGYSGYAVSSVLVFTALLNAFKQIVNVQQLLDGMYHLAVIDVSRRKK